LHCVVMVVGEAVVESPLQQGHASSSTQGAPKKPGISSQNIVPSEQEASILEDELQKQYSEEQHDAEKNPSGFDAHIVLQSAAAVVVVVVVVIVVVDVVDVVVLVVFVVDVEEESSPSQQEHSSSFTQGSSVKFGIPSQKIDPSGQTVSAN